MSVNYFPGSFYCNGWNNYTPRILNDWFSAQFLEDFTLVYSGMYAGAEFELFLEELRIKLQQGFPFMGFQRTSESHITEYPPLPLPVVPKKTCILEIINWIEITTERPNVSVKASRRISSVKDASKSFAPSIEQGVPLVTLFFFITTLLFLLELVRITFSRSRSLLSRI
jgi:hypothetical protein